MIPSVIGIVISLIGALSQAVSYLISKHFVTVSGVGTIRKLLVVGHVWMGLFSLLLCPFVWMQPLNGWSTVIWPIVGTAAFYFVGQAGFFWTVKQIPASRLSPLLGVKILFLGVFSSVLFSEIPSTGQWAAILLAAGAAMCLTQIGGALSGRALFGLAWTCTGYSMSDLFIPQAIHAFDGNGGFQAALFSVAIGYSGLGLVVLPFVHKMGCLEKVLWKRALPFAITWYIGMICLFAAIGMIGIILAVIIQSTRGLWSIVLGKMVADRELNHLESQASDSQWIRQGAAAFLMTMAVAVNVIFQ